MISNVIPHTAFLQNCSAVIPATFSASGFPGVYSLPTAAVNLMNLKPNAGYLIDRFSFSASIPDYDWCASMDTIPPLMQLKCSSTGQIFPRPYALAMYKPDAAFNGWFKTDTNNDTLQVSVSGTFNQIADTIGIATINLVVSFDIYEMTNTAFQVAMRSGISDRSGQQIRGN